MKFVPQLFGLKAARDLRHLLARDARVGGDERLRAHRGRAPAEVPVPVQRGQISQGLLVAGGLLHKLFCFIYFFFRINGDDYFFILCCVNQKQQQIFTLNRETQIYNYSLLKYPAVYNIAA